MDTTTYSGYSQKVAKQTAMCPIHPNCILKDNHMGLCILSSCSSRRAKSFETHIEKSVKTYKRNTYVLAQFGKDDDELWFPGIITRVHRDDIYDINYFDGDAEEFKPAARIRPLEYDIDKIDQFVIFSYKK